jgi:hypothetical protein
VTEHSSGIWRSVVSSREPTSPFTHTWNSSRDSQRWHMPPVAHISVSKHQPTREHPVSSVVRLQSIFHVYNTWNGDQATCSGGIFVPSGPSVLHTLRIPFKQTAVHRFPSPDLVWHNWWNSSLKTGFLKPARSRLRGSGSTKWLHCSHILLRTSNPCSSSIL